MKPITERRLFAIADGKLSKKQQWVQATHAVAQHCLEQDNWKNGYLVMKQTKDLQNLIDKLREDGVHYSFFRDSFFGERVTAISAVDIDKYVKEMRLI